MRTARTLPSADRNDNRALDIRFVSVATGIAVAARAVADCANTRGSKSGG